MRELFTVLKSLPEGSCSSMEVPNVAEAHKTHLDPAKQESPLGQPQGTLLVAGLSDIWLNTTRYSCVEQFSFNAKLAWNAKGHAKEKRLQSEVCCSTDKETLIYLAAYQF